MTERCTLLIAALLVMSLPEAVVAQATTHTSPRIIAMNIARPVDYDKREFQVAVARADVAILGFWPGWDKSKKGATMRGVVRALKSRNPNILIGQYTILNDARDAGLRIDPSADLGDKLTKEGWWLLDANGKRKRWTDRYGAFDVNATEWVKPDRDRLRYPQWLARRNYLLFFKPVPEFGIWYFDISLNKPPVKSADWDRDGRDDSADDPRVAAAYRRGNVAYWEAARALAPKALFIGNADDVSSPEYSGKLQGVFLEAMIGRRWSTEARAGWPAMMARYRSAMKHTSDPRIVGFNVWGARDDYQRMRYGLASCMLDDGYFSYTDQAVDYSSVPWFDEYDTDLGTPEDAPPLAQWKNGVYRRNFSNGAVLVNPTSSTQTVTLEPGYRRLRGGQAPSVNNDQPADKIALAPKDGILLRKFDRR